VSVGHPFVVYALERVAGHNPNYHETYNWTGEWTIGGQTIPMSFWNRPLHAMTDAFRWGQNRRKVTWPWRIWQRNPRGGPLRVETRT
jgi:hypothetical protein